MADINENRPGYKKTKVGWIPEVWEVKPLKKLLNKKVTYGIVKPG